MSLILVIPALVTLGAIGTCVACLWIALRGEFAARRDGEVGRTSDVGR